MPQGTNKLDTMVIEAKVTKPTGKQWEVTIIGAKGPDDIVTHEGRQYLRSDNGRLYDLEMLAQSAPMWEGVKVYDNHLTQEEFIAKQGMRSPAKEWLGAIVNTRWDAKTKQLKGLFKVVDSTLAQKLKNAWDLGVLKTIGLSIDAFTDKGREAYIEGVYLPIIEGFKKIESVDLVGNPAAGGGFVRIMAARVDKEINSMEDETHDEVLTRDDIKQLVSDAVVEALAARESEEIDEMTDEEVVEAVQERDKTKAEVELEKIERRAQEAKRETDLARTELYLERALDRAKMPDKFSSVIRSQFKDRVVENGVIDDAIKTVREAYASVDPTGRVKAGGTFDVHVGLNDEDKFELAVSRILMGERDLRALELHDDETVKERVNENRSYQAWIKAGKPEIVRYPKLSALFYDYFGGDLILNNRAMEAATTSTLSTVVKNTVNIMAANDYSQRELWWEPIVEVHEVDTIDDATLARVYGTAALSTVSEGAAYTELQLADEEETASFVKRGNYVGITIETLMRDKINYVRRIPQVLANTWYNTQSDLVSNVFTVNTAAGPVLGTTGALFNATAVTSAGGHANLLTTALSHAQFGTVRTAMMKQTDNTLGTGRKLLITPRYLLVPVDLETTALDIRNSELVPGESGGATSGGQIQTTNNYRGTFDVIVVPTWTDTDNWAAVGDPMRFPAIHLVYPRGQRAPQIFTADSELGGSMFTNDELRFKVRLMTYRFSSTYDCAPVSDFRPLHKSNV